MSKMSKAEAQRVLDEWLGRKPSAASANPERPATSGELAAQLIGDEMSGGGIDTYAAAVARWMIALGKPDGGE